MFPALVALLLATQTPKTETLQIQQVCGTIASLQCDSSDRTLMTLLVQPGVAVRVVAPTDGAGMAMRGQLSLAREQRVCVSGLLGQHQNAVTTASFTVADAADVVVQGEPAGDWPTTDVYTTCDSDFHAVSPKMGARPSYTDAALKAHIEGSAWVQAIVGVDGRVERVRLVKSLDPVHGLDEEALKAARLWTFNPATRAGQPVRALAMMELTFTLRK
jgi:TonB family protein